MGQTDRYSPITPLLNVCSLVAEVNGRSAIAIALAALIRLYFSFAEFHLLFGWMPYRFSPLGTTACFAAELATECDLKTEQVRRTGFSG